MKKIFICNKIIRDKDVSLFQERGIEPETRILHRDEIVPFLKKKIKEEAQEACEAQTPEGTLNEMVDVYEAGMALCHALGISKEAFWALYKEKHDRKGGFDQNICLCTLTMSTEHPEIHHYLSQPGKYPEKK